MDLPETNTTTNRRHRQTPVSSSALHSVQTDQHHPQSSVSSSSTAASIPPVTTTTTTRSSQRSKDSPSRLTVAPSSSAAPVAPRRSARLSTTNSSTVGDQASPSNSTAKGKKKADPPSVPSPSKRTCASASSPPVQPATSTTTDRKGKKRAVEPPSSSPDKSEDPTPAAKRTKPSSPSKYQLRSNKTESAGPSKAKGKSKANPTTSTKKSKAMPRKAAPSKKAGQPSSGDRSKKGDASNRHLIGNNMDEDEHHWAEAGGSGAGLLDDHFDEDVDMDHSDQDDDDDEHAHDGDEGGNAYDRLARLTDGALFDEAAAALFGGDFRGFGGMMSGVSSMFKRLKTNLRSPSSAVRLAALRECSDLLLVSNEDTLGGSFSTTAFATEFIAILNGKPNIDKTTDGDAKVVDADAMDEDAELAAALAMSTGGAFSGDEQEDMEAQLLACRCLAHLMEALPGSGHNLVHLGAVPVLCSKLNEISYIELAEQTLSTMEKISAEYPGAIVREGGLAALLNFLPFFSTNVQRTAVTAAANCCRNLSSDHFARVRDVFPILRDVLTQSDQRLVEQATLAVLRTLESYRHNAEHLEGLLDLPTVVAINALLVPSGGSPLISDTTYTHLLKALTSAARASSKVSIAFLEAGMTNTVHYILTGVLPSSHESTSQGDAPGGQSLGGGLADMAIMQNLAHRPKDQVEESLALISELLPPIPRDGVFDSRGYSEKALAKIVKRGGKPQRPRPRTSKASEGSGSSSGPGTPTEASTAAQDAALGTLGVYHLGKKKEAEAQYEHRLSLLKSNSELVQRFMGALVPVLVDVYAASVSLRVRTKALTGLVKAVAFANPEDLKETLQSVPMSSFLDSIISSKDNPAFVALALQAVELLAVKLPDVYLTSFLREGVVYEIETLAKEELSTKIKAAEKAEEVAKAEKSSKDAEEATTKDTGSPEDTKPDVFFAPKTPTGGSSDPAFESTRVLANLMKESASRPVLDANDNNIIRARIILAKNIFAMDGDQHNEAALVLDELARLVQRICAPDATEAELRDALREIAAQFSNVGSALSSFELLKSGLIDGLLEYVDIDGTVPSSVRRTILYEIFSDTAIATPSPLAMLVKRLHESLGRLENLEVETAFNGAAGSSSASALGRSMRIRLQAGEGEDIPKQLNALSVTIQAIAPIQTLHDYLLPRIVDPAYMSGASTLQNMFAAYAAQRGGAGGGGSTSRLLAALAGAGGPGAAAAGRLGGLPLPPAEAATRTEAAQTSGAAVTPATEATLTEEKPGRPQRRRSARLSGQPAEGQQAEGGSEPATTSAAATAATSDAPVHRAPGDILSEMTMGMDFDEEFTDEEYDAEVFEEEMEEELARRPTEKVVNMSVTSDGSRVEAKTPDGTRVQTPNQAAAQSSAAAVAAATPGGSSTPSRTGNSYAGAVKTAPTDWHLEFSINGEVLSLEDTIYGAVHRHSKTSASSAHVFGLPVSLIFRKIEGPAPTKAPQDAPTLGASSSQLPPILSPDAPVSKILRLLRVVHGLCVEYRDATGRLDGPDENMFVSNKLTAKLTRQLEETMIIASNCLPEWAVELPKHFSFLFPFDTRYNFLRSTSFGYGRLIAHWQASQPRNSNNSRRDDNLSHLGRLVRQKVRISRAQLLESCVKVLELYGTSNGILEVEYFDEIGTGLGPTLEFYAMASKEFARRQLGLWRDEDETKEGQYVWHPRGLFPAPLKPGEPADSQVLSFFKTMSVFVGRALLDSRIIDLNFNKVFLKSVLGQPIKPTIATLKLVDEPLARSLERLQTYLHTRQEIEALTSLPASSRRSKLAALTIGGAKLADLSLDFTLPGYNIELKPGGRTIDVDDSNLEEYIELVLDLTLNSGIAQQVKQFRDGFSSIFSIRDLEIFSPEEFGLLCGNADEDWSRETLSQAIKADHGYNSDSRVVRDLIDIMSSYTKDERRQFLQFMTGAPKLPLGGFKGLNPQFTVVRKPHEAPFKADDYLPSVMTCASYLKLPDYSSKAILGSQLTRCMHDGQGSFNLS